MPNITLAIDDDLLKRARAHAKRKGTTVNSLVRQQLTEAIESERRMEDARRGLQDLIERSTARMGKGFKINRDEMYGGEMLSGHKHPRLRGGRKAGLS